MGINLFYGILAVAAVLLFIAYYKNHHTLSGILLTAIQGICAFFAVNFIGAFCSVHLNLNLYSGLVSIFGGTPGVIFLLLMNMLVNIKM